MDFKKILSASKTVSVPVPAKVVEEPKPEQPKEPIKPLLCVCSHPIDAHDDCGPCTILECDCPGFISDNSSELDEKIAQKAKAIEDVQLHILPEPSTDLSTLPDDLCHHLCENPDCLKWWSHGKKSDCAYPDLVKQGNCQTCNDGNTYQVDFEKDFEIKDGKPKLDAAALVKVRNTEGEICKFMTSRQLTLHILFYQKRIEEYYQAMLHARKIRADKEEEELKDIPESERERFILALRKGDDTKSSKKGKTPRKETKAKEPKKDDKQERIKRLAADMKSQGMDKDDAKMIALTMVNMGKTQKEAEAWFYGD